MAQARGGARCVVDEKFCTKGNTVSGSRQVPFLEGTEFKMIVAVGGVLSKVDHRQAIHGDSSCGCALEKD
jgi:hypothetical protein